MPATVRDATDAVLGSPVVETSPLVGGFSPGPAVRADLADGRAVFLKAAGLDLNPDSPGMHRREAAVLAALTSDVPAPHLLGVVDDDDWVVLATEYLPGHNPDPVRPADLGRAIGLLADLARLTANGPGPLRPFLDTHPTLAGRWAGVAAEPDLVERLDGRTRRHLDALVERERDVGDASAGGAIVHGDARTDNMLLTAERAVLVDWPAASLGAPWVDLVLFLPAVHLDGGPPPAEVFATATASGRFGTVDDAVDVVIAAMAGFFVGQSLLPPPPGLPTLRAFQAAQGRIATDWCLDRLGLR